MLTLALELGLGERSESFPLGVDKIKNLGLPTTKFHCIDEKKKIFFIMQSNLSCLFNHYQIRLSKAVEIKHIVFDKLILKFR